MFCSGIVLSLCQIVRIHTGSTFQANIKVGMQFFSETCWSYFRHSTSVWLTETPYHSTWKDASTIDHRYIHTGIIQRVCMTCFFGCIDLFVAQRCSSPFPAIVEVGMSFAGSKIDIYIYIYMYIFWKGEVMKWKILEDVKHLWSTPSSRKACIYGLTGVDFSSVKSSSWILCIAQQLQVCQPSPSDVWCWRACRGRRDFYICFHFWQFVWNTMIILLRYPMNLHNWLHAISCLKNHWVEVWR